MSAENFLHIMGWGDFQSTAGVTVNIDNALGVPAVWAAVNFISGTLASLPLEVYRGNVTDGIGTWLNRAINPTMSSFQWRKYSYEQVLTGGRSVTLILRNGRGDVTDLVTLDPADLHVQEQVTAEFPTKTYRSKSRVYQASEVIDLTFHAQAQSDRHSWSCDDQQRHHWFGDCSSALRIESIPIGWHSACGTTRAIPERCSGSKSVGRYRCDHSKTGKERASCDGSPCWT